MHPLSGYLLIADEVNSFKKINVIMVETVKHFWPITLFGCYSLTFIYNFSELK